MSYKFLIVEDDVLISEHLRSILQRMQHQVLGICGSRSEAITCIQNERPDFALLDIRMHGKDQGIEVAEYLKSIGVPFIFITSFSDKKTLQSAVKQQPKGYILKPFSAEEVEDVIRDCVKELKDDFVYIKESNGSTKVNHSDILWIQADNVYIEIHTAQKKYVVREKLNVFLEDLPEDIFAKVHRSYVVNKEHIDRIETNSIYLGETQIPVSKTYKSELNSI